VPSPTGPTVPGPAGLQVMRQVRSLAEVYVLGRVVHAISGLDLRDFLLPRLFSPRGIRNPQWLRCPLGFPLGAIGLQLRSSEITRITSCCCCTRAPGAAIAWFPVTTSPG
jgi:hypothetical protein